MLSNPAHRRRMPLRRLAAVLVAGILTLAGTAATAAADPPDPVAPTDTAWSWGENRYGQAGNGDSTVEPGPTPGRVALPEGVTVTQLDGGASHTLAVTADGRVLAWGRNTWGQVGDGTTTDRTTPVAVDFPAGVTVTRVAANGDHSLALTADGRVFAWGYNNFGQVGDGSGIPSRPTPVEVALPAGVTATGIASGQYHSLAMASDGRVFAWGRNRYGELGDGTTTIRTTPVEAQLPADTTVTQIAAGAYHGMALTADGRVLAWGYNASGQLGDGTTTDRTTPVEVQLPADTTVTQLAAGGNHAMARTADGRALTWGYNFRGQLGDGTTTDRTAPVEVQLPADTTVTQLAAGNNHSMALTADGRALTWGYNGLGQLGDGTTTAHTTPVEVDLPARINVTQVASGANFGFALTEPRASDVALAADPTEATEGTTVTLTAEVDCTATTATGTVTFSEGDAEIGTAELDEHGVATLRTDDLPVGDHRITARYPGDLACPAAVSNPVAVTITPEASPTATSTSPEPTATATSDPTETGPPAPAPTPPHGQLPVTGSSVGPLLGIGAALVALGATLIAWRRHRVANRRG